MGTFKNAFSVVQLGSGLNQNEFYKLCPTITPTLSSELLIDNYGTMEAGDPPTGWIASTNTVTSEADERTGGNGTKSLQSARGAGQPAAANVYIIIASVYGKYFQLSGWVKNVNASGGGSIDISSAVSGRTNTTTNWVYFFGTGRSYNAGTTQQIQLKRECNAEGQSVRFDDVSVKEITFSTMHTYIGTSKSQEGEWWCYPTVENNTQAGMLINYLDANNHFLVVVDRAKNALGADRAYIYKCVAGVYSAVVVKTITYVAGAKLRVLANGNKYSLFYDGLSLLDTVEVTSGILGYDVYGFSSYSGNSVGYVGKMSIQPVTFPNLSNVVIAPTTIVPLNFIDGVLYGTPNTAGGTLYKSTDYGENWTLQGGTGVDAISFLMKLDDGEVVALGTPGVYKSSGWNVNPATATFALKQAVSAGASPLPFQLDTYGSKVILAEYAASPHNPAKKWYLSTDYGETYSVILDLHTLYPTLDSSVHPHAACIDHRNGDLWISNGDGGAHDIRKSTDNGANWTKINTVYSAGEQPTTLKSSIYGIVAGTDTLPGGIQRINHKDEIDYLVAITLGGFGFANHAVRDTNGIVYTGFDMSSGEKSPNIYASDGRYGNKIYQVAAISGFRVKLIMIHNGIMVCALMKEDNSFNILRAMI